MPNADHLTTLAGKTAAGSGGAIAAVTTPSDFTGEYVSFFDRVYDWGWFLISGDDVSRFIGIAVGVLVAINIIYTIVKDVRERGKQGERDDLPPA